MPLPPRIKTSFWHGPASFLSCSLYPAADHCGKSSKRFLSRGAYRHDPAAAIMARADRPCVEEERKF
ncbi:hypothetical protein K432DRAFT_379578 [Lepidopterella palustris CBS 459.81]|uniref:Uncharacterized protein n=1 Tax=Lepidopterella palustris CBS 459.81 TaxID=1314670 RepID=A0A8E2EGE5_9PEZI|nr:hypothetical protein K432DRAFT_379578 [Lepidopterella palustris CBS 459.81]